MPPTPKGIVYPTLDDEPNGPAQMQALSESSDSALESRDIALGFTSPKSDGSGTVVRSGKASIAAAETRTNVAYGLLTTQDRVQNIRVETDGLIAIWYQATWQESVSGAGRAAIFIGATQLHIASLFANDPQAAKTDNSGATARDISLSTCSFGLVSAQTGTGAYPGDVTTGQVVGVAFGALGELNTGQAGVPAAGPCYVFAAAGTYDVSVQFKSSSGSVTVKNRVLRVRSYSF